MWSTLYITEKEAHPDDCPLGVFIPAHLEDSVRAGSVQWDKPTTGRDYINTRGRDYQTSIGQTTRLPETGITLISEANTKLIPEAETTKSRDYQRPRLY